MLNLKDVEHLGKSIETETEVDVAVVGGGTAGFVAAVAAARTGARTAVIDSQSFLGGTMTGSMVTNTAGFRHMPRNTGAGDSRISFEGKQLVEGIAQEFADRMLKYGGTWGEQGKSTTVRMSFDPEIAKVVVEEMVMEAGVDIWLLTQLADVVMEGNQVVGLLVASSGALHLVRTKAVVDSSGDAVVCYRAGAEYQIGRASDGATQAATLIYVLAGVDFHKLVEHLISHPEELVGQYVASDPEELAAGRATADTLEQRLSEGKPMKLRNPTGLWAEAIKRGEIPIPYGADGPHSNSGGIEPIWGSGRLRPDITAHNMDMAFGFLPDRVHMTQAMIACRKFILKMSEYFRKNVPGYENSYLLMTAPYLGIRGTRRVVGDYMLTEEDTLAGREFPDAVGRFGRYFDVHASVAGEKNLKQTKGYLIEVGGAKGWYHVPYRILLPKGLEGVLTAGRCVSIDSVAHGSIRGEIGCMLTGQAAGTAAALAAKLAITPRVLDVKVLQETLREQGVII